MLRAITQAYRESVESWRSSDSDRIFLRIYHPTSSEEIRVVNDNVDYNFNGFLWTRCPFGITFMSDDESPPQGKITIQNVDRRIGRAIRGLTAAPRMEIFLYASFEFDATVTPRVAIGTPTIQYEAKHLRLTGISVDQVAVSATIEGWNYTQRAYPGRRATQDFCPGLYR